MIVRRRIPDAVPRYDPGNEAQFRRALTQHIHEVAANDESFRARYVSGTFTSPGAITPGNWGVVTVSGFNGVTARVLATASGNGAGGADMGATEVWVNNRDGLGCDINYRNTATVAQVITVDWLAVVPE